MAGGLYGSKIAIACGQRDQNNNLEASIASDTVNREVKTDSFRGVFLYIAG
jgi:hypothetical protein